MSRRLSSVASSLTSLRRGCLGTSIALCRSSHPIPARPIHLSSRVRNDNEEGRRDTEEDFEGEGLMPDNRLRDEFAYAREATRRTAARWAESKDPRGKFKFMTFGDQFTLPYSMSEMSGMSLNHLREIRSYYRKIMYEMPQFARIHPSRATC
jgi:hypothetical protein